MSTLGLIEYKDASPEVRAIYDDIMTTRKTDWINNFWKAIAHDPAAKAYMEERGIRPEEAGRVAVEGVEAGAFFIFTHSHAIDLAERRFRDQRAGSERRWPAGTARDAAPDTSDPNA